MKKIILFLGVLLFSLVAVGCGKNEESTGEVEIKGITISSEQNLRTIKEGETLQLTAVVYPSEANQEVVWTSEAAEVATVDANGLVTGVGAGTTSIVATSKANSNVSQEFALIVEEAETVVIAPTNITIETVSGSTTCKAGEKIELVAYVLPREASQSVSWSSSDITIATVSRGEVTALKAGEVVITATSKELDTVFATITLTIEPADRPEVSGDWVSMPFSTHEDYESSENDTKLKVKGVVTHVSPVKDGKVNYFIQNGTDGYYVYSQDSVVYPVEEGKVYEVGGYKKYYNGLNEIVNVEYFIEISEEITYQTNNLEGLDTTSLDTMLPLQASVVTGSGLFVSGTVNTSKAFNITLNVGGYETIVRFDPSYSGTEEFEAICNKVNSLVVGVEVEFTGFMTAYGYGTPKIQIQVVKASDLVAEEAGADVLLEACASKIAIPEAVGFSVNSIVIPTSVEGFSDVKLSWESNSDLINVATGEVTHASEDSIVTLTLTLTLEETTITKTYTVKVEAKDDKVYETLVTLDLEDAVAEGNYGCSTTKGSYNAATVTLGTPAHSWLLQGALIAFSDADKREGQLSIRAQQSADLAKNGRIEILEAGEYNLVEFKAAVYGSNALGIQLQIEYTFDDGTTWSVADTVVTVGSYTLETFRIKLPEGVKRVAIVVVQNSGQRVNIDDIKLMK